MIERLVELRLAAFRAYGGDVTVPLDADVVLVHGANGRGKSSLLAALELAISGEVADLAHFEDDYPRCLRYRPADGSDPGPTEVELAYRSGADGPTCRLRRRVQPRVGKKKGLEVVAESLVPETNAAPSDDARRFFLERGYLSQRRLGRLLEIYQAPDPTSKEQPLVRVLRELLGLDPIGHLTLGLHSTQNTRWLRSRSAALRRLADEEARLARDREGWRARIARIREDLRRRFAELRELLPVFAVHIPEDLGGETPEVIDLDTPTGVFDGTVTDFEGVRRGSADLHRRRGVLETVRRMLDVADAGDSVRFEADAVLAELASSVGLDPEPRPKLEVLADALALEEADWTEAARAAREQEASRLRAELLLERAVQVRSRLVDGLAQEVSFERREAELQAVRDRIDTIVDAAQAVRAAALDVQQRFVAPVFDERLNRFWGDLFGRLALAEPFRPELSEPETHRGRLQATTRAVLGPADEAGFEQLGAILSSGNLNTAALTLFVALHFLEEPAAKVLVIDDPVQAMDDVHTVQLAGLLRAIARGDSPRQLILAVHERALFDYLRLELGPTTEGASLLAITVERETGAPSSTVRWERDVWRGDEVRFG